MMKEHFIAWKKENNAKKIVDIIALLVIFAGALVSIYMNMAGRSLWVDEAMLSYSFSSRSLLNLTSSVFEWDQSAPVLYLYIVKLLTLIFGNTEAVLRSFSVFSYMAVLFLSYLAGKRLFKMRYPLWIAAFLANMNFMLEYSNMFKQYISECIWVLLVLLVYDAYKERGLSFVKMLLLFMVFIWGANPACFMIGGVLAYEFFEALLGMQKSKKASNLQDFAKWKTQLLHVIYAGVGILISFAADYFYWLKKTANSGLMTSYWENANFPLIPGSAADVKMALAMIYEIFVTYREARLIIEFLLIAALVIGLFKEKNRYVIVIAIGIFVALFASFIKMFPIADRLWCFAFPLFVILAFYALDRAASANTPVFLCLMIALLLTNNGISVYRHSENVYRAGEEINPNIAYVQENIKDGEQVYVYLASIPNVKYKIGYDTNRIGNVSSDNIIWATEEPKNEEENENIEKVLASDGCYILCSHCPEERIGRLFEMAMEEGSLEVVKTQYDTSLYYYTKDVSKRKGAVSYELVDREDEDDTCYVTVRVTNVGTGYVNSDREDVLLTSAKREEISTPLWHNLAPGESFDMPMSFEWDDDTEVALQLFDTRFGFDGFKAAPLVIRKGE